MQVDSLLLTKKFKLSQHLFITKVTLFIVALIMLVSCGGSDTQEKINSEPSTLPVNNVPIASAGSDQTIVQGSAVLLNASNSYDADGDNLTYHWTITVKPTGSNAALTSTNDITTSFVVDVEGQYQVELVVNDGQSDSVSDFVTIIVNSEQSSGPVAVVNNQLIAYTEGKVNLDATESYSPQGDILTYLWQLTEPPAASAAVLENEDSVQAYFIPDVQGSYVVTLTVFDNTQASDTATVIINVAHWMTNNVKRSSYIKQNGNGVKVNVQSVSSTIQNNQPYISFAATGIPDYRVTLTDDDIEALNARPNASNDFALSGGKAIVSTGDTIEFGQDIGYEITRAGCELGYWPPGPECPANQNKAGILPVEPKPADNNCETGLNAIGVMLNGTSVFNWQDGQSYNNQRVWHNLAPKFEVYDVDICLGHAQLEGDYHHHMFSKCLQDLMNDTGDSHSPIYGFAADGYPIHGPYYGNGVLAKPSWMIRDYDNPSSDTGCDQAGKRSCQLVDQYDISKGTKTVTSGPDVDATVNSMSRNPIATVAGVYYEDYYHDATLAGRGGKYLDKHNGHDHDNYGYHYHITVEEIDGKLAAVFPYQVGPEFYGEVPSGGLTSCQ